MGWLVHPVLFLPPAMSQRDAWRLCSLFLLCVFCNRIRFNLVQLGREESGCPIEYRVDSKDRGRHVSSLLLPLPWNPAIFPFFLSFLPFLSFFSISLHSLCKKLGRQIGFTSKWNGTDSHFIGQDASAGFTIPGNEIGGCPPRDNYIPTTFVCSHLKFILQLKHSLRALVANSTTS